MVQVATEQTCLLSVVIPDSNTSTSTSTSSSQRVGPTPNVINETRKQRRDGSRWFMIMASMTMVCLLVSPSGYYWQGREPTAPLSSLRSSKPHEQHHYKRKQRRGVQLGYASNTTTASTTTTTTTTSSLMKATISSSTTATSLAANQGPTSWDPPLVQKRCEWVLERFAQYDKGTPAEDLKIQYQAQSLDANVFYRATAHLFWNDFVTGHWGDELILSLKEDATLQGGVALDEKSTWTWVTGDQHLSNFGAWRNRHGDVVFGVNDFDEAAIYDFQIDVLRIAVSVWNHAVTNELSTHQVNKALKVFTETYVQTVVDYVGNEDALLFELTAKTSKGVLKRFLKDVQEDKSSQQQMKKFTIKNDNGNDDNEKNNNNDNDNDIDSNTSGRRFQKGPVGQPDEDTRLAAVSPEREAEIRHAFTSTNYGATMMKLGWAVHTWDDDFFTVLDVAARVGSGIGSYGVDRYYILLQGTDGLLLQGGGDGTAVVLDVKYQPEGAVSQILTPMETAWYNVIFPNAAARTVEAQRRLTSYTDPYTGWILLEDNNSTLQPFSVRQRSPWKDSPDLDDLTDHKDFTKFMSQIAAATATSHVRGTVAKAPGDFKHVIKALLGNENHNNDKLERWGTDITRLASAYHEQVLLDYSCFQEHVHATFPEPAEGEATNN